MTSSTAGSAPLVFLPGPTALHPLVATETRAALTDGFLSESHRSPRFRASVAAMEEALRSLLRIPEDHRILIVGSATEAMERIIQGTVTGRSAHLLNGAFAWRMRDVSGNLGREVVEVTVPDGRGFPSTLDAFPPPGIDGLLDGAEVLAMTQNETSTGVRIPPDQVHTLADRARKHGALSVVDLVTGWPSEEVDPARVDCGFFSVQKGFGLPAGLGILVVSPAFVERARELQAQGHVTGGYMGIPALAQAADRHETRATPNMLGIRLLAAVAADYAREGREALDRAVTRRAETFWTDVEGLPGLTPFVEAGPSRSRTILVLEVAGGSGPLRDRLARRGLLVGDGYGPGKGRHLRVANFPVQTDAMMERLLEGLAAEA